MLNMFSKIMQVYLKVTQPILHIEHIRFALIFIFIYQAPSLLNLGYKQVGYKQIYLIRKQFQAISICWNLQALTIVPANLHSKQSFIYQSLCFVVLHHVGNALEDANCSDVWWLSKVLKILTLVCPTNWVYWIACLTTKATAKKQQYDASSTNVAGADSVNVDFSKMKIGQTRIR